MHPRVPSTLAALALLAWLPLACGEAPAPPAAPPAGADVPRAAPPATADAPDEAEAPAGPVVAFLGDSLAAGLHLDPDQAFPAVLQRRLAEEGLPFRLVNAGLSGDTTSGGLGRLDWILRQQPELVVLELGSNDGLRGIPLDTVESNLLTLVERCRAAGARVLLLGARLPTNYGEPYADGFAAVFDRVAAEHDVPYVPFFLEGVALVPELNLPDGLHPNPEGHARIADNVAPRLRELLAEDG